MQIIKEDRLCMKSKTPEVLCAKSVLKFNPLFLVLHVSEYPIHHGWEKFQIYSVQITGKCIL